MQSTYLAPSVFESFSPPGETGAFNDFCLSLLKLYSLLHSKQWQMNKRQIITASNSLRDAVRDLWAKGAVFDWRWKEWEPRQDRGIDAIGELILDGRRVPFLVEFRLNPGAR